MHSLAVWKGLMWPCHLQRGGEAMFGLREFWEVILPQHQCPGFKVLNAQKHGSFITKEKNLFILYILCYRTIQLNIHK